MPSVYVSLSNFPKGKNVTVPGLGTFKNGSTTEVDQRKYDRFAKKPGIKVVNRAIYITSNNDEPPELETKVELEEAVESNNNELEEIEEKEYS